MRLRRGLWRYSLRLAFLQCPNCVVFDVVSSDGPGEAWDTVAVHAVDLDGVFEHSILVDVELAVHSCLDKEAIDGVDRVSDLYEGASVELGVSGQELHSITGIRG